ncbi:hypothetical protein ACLKMH_14025 [Psychromonas sp. KJ10-10]|uniref:hypothetical protein n=1 Tax=Psychromonas sp. KJ10-10 TaxID=3391823 RepID=UPI0039B4BA6B
MSQWIKAYLMKQIIFNKPTGLTIRKSLLLGFSAMSFIMILATLVALYSTNQVSKSMAVILEQRLPAMLQSSQIAKAVNELAVTGTSFQSVKNDNDLAFVEQEFFKAVEDYKQSLKGMDNIVRQKAHIRNFSNALTENLEKLRTLAKQQH